MQFKDYGNSSGGKGDGKFLRLEDGQSVKGVFQGNPVVFWVLWKNNKSIIVSEGTPESKPRFKINFITKENGSLVAKIWEGSMTTYRMLKDIHEEFNLSQTMVKISRSGSGKETVYNVLPTRDALDSKALKQIQAVKLHDLTVKPEPFMVAVSSSADDQPDIEEMVL